MSNDIRNSKTNTGKSTIKDFFSVNDLREKDYQEINLLPNERLAIKNFDRYRICELNKQKTETHLIHLTAKSNHQVRG